MSNPDSLRSFLSYKGSKRQLAPFYPKPEYSVILEPFAGSAGYSCFYYRRRVVLLDAYSKVANIWGYLRRTTKQQILSLPAEIPPGMSINDRYPNLRQVERDLIAFWLDRGSPKPRYTPSNWMQKHPNAIFWPKARLFIAEQVRHIRHWAAYHADYRSMAGVTHTTIFIDPPYQLHGSSYPRSYLDYDELREHINALHYSNQIIVSEGEGADWLPFEFFRKGRRSTHKSGGLGPNELIYYRPSRDRKPAVGCGFDLAPPPQEEEIDMKAHQMTQAAELEAVMGNETLDLAEVTKRLKLQNPKVPLKKLYHSARAVLSRNSARFVRVAPGVYRVINPSVTPAANGNSVGQKWESKTAFIRAHLHLAPQDVVTLGKRYGYTLQLQMIYTVRSAAKVAGIPTDIEPSNTSVALVQTTTEALVMPEGNNAFDEGLLRIVDAALNTDIAKERLEVVRHRVQVLTRARVEMMIRKTAKEEVEAYFSNL